MTVVCWNDSAAGSTGYPLFYLLEHEEQRMARLLHAVARTRHAERPLRIWSAARGFHDDGSDVGDPMAALEQVVQRPEVVRDLPACAGTSLTAISTSNWIQAPPSGHESSRTAKAARMEAWQESRVFNERDLIRQR